MKKISLLTLVLLCAPFLVHAQGGSCPSGANYINPANNGVAGPLVPLSTLGVTKCFYIAANGADTNPGTSEASPWLHAPGMPNCANTCALTTPIAGNGFIFRGGDTWHYFTGSPQVGGQWTWTRSGTSSNYIYIGVDQSWYAGGSWTRPILNNDNPQTAGGVVSSCVYNQGNLQNVYLNGVVYVWFDNFEFSGMCWNDVPTNSTNQHIYFAHNGPGGTTSYTGISNNYFHNWTHTAFVCSGLGTTTLGSGGTGFISSGGTFTVNGSGGLSVIATGTITGVSGGAVTTYTITYAGSNYTTGTKATTITSGPAGTGFTVSVSSLVSTTCANPVEAIAGSTQAALGTQILFNVVDGADSDDLAMSDVDSDAYIMAYNVFRHLGGSSVVDNCHSIHDNLWEYINNVQDGSAHSDLLYCYGRAVSNNFFYNNQLRYVGTEYNQSLSTVIWFTPAAGYTTYFFNTVSHDVNCVSNCYNMNNPSSAATLYLYNNTMESMNTNEAIWANSAVTNTTIYDCNNHYITNSGSTLAKVYALTTTVSLGSGCSASVFQTIATANAQGYTSANDFAPTAASTATVTKGANESSRISTFGLAYGSSTTNGCIYVTTNHTVSCPGITANPRPPTAAWDAGAYLYGGTSSSQPAAPTNLTATVN